MFKQLIVTSLITLSTTITFSQHKEYSCSHVKSKEVSAKTPTLTNSQLAETDKYDVHFYGLDLNMTDANTSLSGSGTIKGKTLVATDSILFELYKTFTIDSIYLNGSNVSFARNQSVVKVPINTSANNLFNLKVFYRGTPPTAASNPLGGSGMSNDVSPSWGTRATWSLSEPFSAYEWFPVKQVLRDKADSCAVNITVENRLKAGSNGNLDSITDNGNGTSTYHWYHRHPIAYYLVSVAVADYQEYNVYAFAGTPQEILIQNYIYNNPNLLSSAQTEINYTADFIELFSDLYGMYPFANEKYGHCMAPISGGMEHQTMTTQGFFEKTLTAHELAHQWWGDYVTCDTWANIWINEGFASYSEYLMLQNLFPSSAASDMQQRHSNIMSQTGGSVWVADSTSDASIFSSRLTYNKGAAIVHTLRYIIDNDTLFFNGLRTFLDTYKNKTATALDFKLVLEQGTQMNFDNFFNEWYFGQGFPNYKVQWNNADNGLQLRVTHTTSTNITSTFTNPISIKISRVGLSDTIVRLPIQSNSEIFSFENFPSISNVVSIDPENWIINRVTSISKDTDLALETSIVSAKNDIKIYPVPATDFVTIEGENEMNYNLQILDIKGSLIETITFKGNYQLPLTKYPTGAYIIKVATTEGYSAQHKFIKR